VWFDDLMLKTSSSTQTQNLLEHGNFEYLGPAGLPVGISGTPGRLSRDLQKFKVGYASLRMSGLPSGEVMAQIGEIPVALLSKQSSLKGSFHFCATSKIKARLIVELLDHAGNTLSRRLMTRDFEAKPNLWQATSFRFDTGLQKDEAVNAESAVVKVVGSIPQGESLYIDEVIVMP